jgi:hypothetical protein
MPGTILVTRGTMADFVVDGLAIKGKKVRVSTYNYDRSYRTRICI